jgi:hypothetical protein
MTHNNGQTIGADGHVDADIAMIGRTLTCLRRPAPEAVTELRMPNVPGSGTISGYFTDINALAAQAACLSGKVPGIYITLNPVNPDLLARANNRVEKWAKHTTSDSDIIRRVWLPIDLDPVRPSGISASDAEHKAALQRAQACRKWLGEIGWPTPILADSGNGAHLLYRIDLPNDDPSTDLIRQCLMALDIQCSDEVVGVDLTTSNAARIWKLYGTRACKGDPIPDRPHRMATLLEVPEDLRVVPLEQLKQLAAMVPEAPKPERHPRRNGNHAAFDLEQWIAEHHVPVDSTKQWKGGRLWVLNPCPWNVAHTNKAAYIVQFPGGAISARCHHNGCAENNWQALRDLYEPGWRTNRHRTSHGGQEDAALKAAIEELVAAVKEDRAPKHVFDAVGDLAHLSSAAFGKVKAELKDILRDKLNLNDLERAVNESRQQLASCPLPELGDDGFPSIQVNDRPLRDMTADALAALEAANEPPSLFVRGGALTRVRRDEQDRPLIETMEEDHMRGMLTRAANVVNIQGDKSSHVSPPRDLVRDILALGSYPRFPALEGVVASPIVRPDGTILQQAGYDPDTRLIYLPPAGFVLPPIPARPRPEEAQQAARWILHELFGDFPLAQDAPDGQGSASQAHALALLLTCILRPLIDGPVPLAMISAPQRGSGKTLLAASVALTATGQEASLMVAPGSDEEWRKRISAVLATGAPIAIIDNVVTTLASPSLAAMLTSRMWQDRLLGRNDQVLMLPARTVWIVTANNPLVDTDLVRRSYVIHLDAKTSRPWQGRTFRHADLLQWAMTHRGEILAALLTMGRAWYIAGQPSAEAPMLGKFEEWTRILSGVLAFAKVPHFLANLQELYEHLDPDAQQWEAFLTVWWQRYGEKPVTVATLVERIKESSGLLQEALPEYLADSLDGSAGNFRKRLGRAFRKHKGVRYGDAGLYLESAGKDSRKNVMQWQVVCGFAGLPGFQPAPVKKKTPPAKGGFWKKWAETNPLNPANPAVDAPQTSSHHDDQNASDDDPDDAEPDGWVLPQSSLPTDVSEWSQDWRLLYNELTNLKTISWSNTAWSRPRLTGVLQQKHGNGTWRRYHCLP